MSNSVSYLDIPKRDFMWDDILEIGYRPKSGNKVKYVYMHKEDKEYIYSWFQRFLAEVCQLSTHDPVLWDQVNEPCDVTELPKSGCFNHPLLDNVKRKNTIISYISGVLSNYYRNPAQDFTKKQLDYLVKCQNMIYWFFHNPGINIGYNSNNFTDNELPYKIQFREY